MSCSIVVYVAECIVVVTHRHTYSLSINTSVDNLAYIMLLITCVVTIYKNLEPFKPHKQRMCVLHLWNVIENKTFFLENNSRSIKLLRYKKEDLFKTFLKKNNSLFLPTVAPTDKGHSFEKEASKLCNRTSLVKKEKRNGKKKKTHCSCEIN